MLEVRPLRVDEAPRVVDYFLGATDADLERMGVVERARLPSRVHWLTSLEATLRTPAAQATTFYLAWLVDGDAIGHASVKNIRHGGSADIHLHMWSAPHRGQGHGTTLFCLSVLDAFDRFALKGLVCEPKASNPMPNRALAKAGFGLVKTYEGSSSELSDLTLLNQYAVDRGTAEAYLRARGLLG